MADNEYRGLLFSALILGAFIILIVTIVSQMGDNYLVSNQKLEEATMGALDKEDLEEDLGEADTEASQFRERFESGDVDDVDDVTGIFSVLGDIVGMITTPIKVLFNIGTNVLHIPDIIMKTLMAIVSLSIIFGIWAVLRKGSWLKMKNKRIKMSEEIKYKINVTKKKFFKDNPNYRNSGMFKKGITSWCKGKENKKIQGENHPNMKHGLYAGGKY